MPTINGSKAGTGGGGGGGGGSVNSVDVANATLVKTGTATDPRFAVVQATVAPLAIGAQTLGTSLKSAKEDHVHAHGNQLGGTLHANADGSSAGFLTSADFTKLAGISASATNTPLTANAPQPVGTAAALGTGTAAAKDDHVHAHGNQTVDTLHALVVAGTSHGFMSKTDKTRLDAMGTASPPGTRTITGASGLSGGGDLSADRTITLDLTAADAWTAAHTWSTTTVPVTSTITDGSAATQLEAARFRHLSSVSGTAGNGCYISGWATNTTPAIAEAGRINFWLRTVVAGSENGIIVIQQNLNGVMTNVGHFANGGLYCPTGQSIGSINATAVTTTLAQWTITNSMVQATSSSAAQGGHAFTGTVNTSGARSFFVITPSSNTATTLSTAVKGFDYQTYTRQWATGAGPAEQAEFVISAPTYAAVAASTFPICSTFAITGAPIAGTNMTITKPLAFHVQAGGSQFDGNVGFYGVSPAAQGTGGQNVTNNVTNSSSVDGTIPDITDGTVYANDYANLRKALYQIARMLKQDHDQLRANGFLT